MEAVGALFLTTAAEGAAAAGAGAAAAAAAPAGLAAFLPSASTALSVLSGVTTGISALSALGRGALESSARRAQSAEASLRAQQEMTIGETEAAKARRQLVDVLGRQAVGYAASGIDLSGGSVEVAQLQAAERSDADLSAARSFSNAKVDAYRRRARQLDAEASLAYSVSLLDAGGKAGKFGVDLARRGFPSSRASRSSEDDEE